MKTNDIEKKNQQLWREVASSTSPSFINNGFSLKQLANTDTKIVLFFVPQKNHRSSSGNRHVGPFWRLVAPAPAWRISVARHLFWEPKLYDFVVAHTPDQERVLISRHNRKSSTLCVRVETLQTVCRDAALPRKHGQFLFCKQVDEEHVHLNHSDNKICNLNGHKLCVHVVVFVLAARC